MKILRNSISTAALPLLVGALTVLIMKIAMHAFIAYAHLNQAQLLFNLH
jgi:hypothetical protein